jgi:hypothetical protein
MIAFAIISPNLLLESLRARLINRFGSISVKAFTEILLFGGNPKVGIGDKSNCLRR